MKPWGPIPMRMLISRAEGCPIQLQVSVPHPRPALDPGILRYLHTHPFSVISPYRSINQSYASRGRVRDQFRRLPGQEGHRYENYPRKRGCGCYLTLIRFSLIAERSKPRKEKGGDRARTEYKTRFDFRKRI